MESLPDIDDCVNYTESEAIEYITDVIKIFNEPETFSNPYDVFCLINRISSSYFQLDTYLDKLSDIFIENNLVQKFEGIIKNFDTTCTEYEEILNLAYTALINFTDKSEKFAQAVHKSDVYKLLIDNCLNEYYILNINDRQINDLIINCLNIVHNVSRYAENKLTYKAKEFKLQMVEFIKRDDSNKLGILAMLTLSYIVEDDDIGLLDVGQNVVELLLVKIKSIVGTKRRSGGYSLCELMHGIECISANDKMKKQIFDSGGILIFIDILKGDHKEAIESTLGTIWQLCFLNEIKMILINQYDIEKVIEKYEHHECSKIKANYNGILWEIKLKDKLLNEANKLENVNKQQTFDVFISYAWENKQKILEIRKMLSEHNLKVWIDEEQMSGSILEAMARGIENSKYIFIAISRPYNMKPNCRSEAEYAHKIRKQIIPLLMELKFQPDGWLGIILGSKLYYDFSKRDANDLVSQLVKSLSDKSLNEASFNEEYILRDRRNDKVRELVKNWTCGQVAKWLEDSKLDHMKRKFIELDGPLLLVLYDIRGNSPEYFNRTLKKEFQMGFMDVLKFHNALNNLLE